MIDFDLMNLIVALIALAVAVYSVAYTRHCNSRKIRITSCEVFSASDDRFMYRFEVTNVSPVSVTLNDISFFDGDKQLRPILDYEPPQTYSYMGSYTELPDRIPDFMFPDVLEEPKDLMPYSTSEFGYYFDEHLEQVNIVLTCEERIHHFKKYQSFLSHFSYIED